jgi:pseudo-rSAM protein
MKTSIDYWFTIEPYVFIGIAKEHVLLYNTLDGVILESDKAEVIELLQETLKEDNCGVVLLTNERYKQKEVKDFISKLREKYMGDIIDISLSNGKPVQLLPFYNFPEKHEIYKKHNFSSFKNVLKNLSKISIHIDSTTNIAKLISFLNSIPGTPSFNIVGNVSEAEQYDKLLSFLNEHPSPKDISCSYLNIIPLQPTFENNFSFQILVKLPIDMKQWNHSRQLLLNQALPVEYVFDISSDEHYLQVEQLVEKYRIEKYRLNPVYTGYNFRFFEENVFLTKEDILSTSMSIKDIFARQVMNIYDFGKINIMPNGDAYANLNYPVLGNIFNDNIYEIVQKEIDEGNSWLRIRNQAPCTDCVYQWLCPSPSIYEISIGRPNLCHVKK